MVMLKHSFLNPKFLPYNHLLFLKLSKIKLLIFLIKTKIKSSLGKRTRKEDGTPTKIKGSLLK